MNRKREDELMQLAFGDLRRDDSQGLHAQVETDPEAAKAYGAYCEMRDGLRALKEIPEMQLSTERLRDAILKEGLQPKRESAWNWSWLATPIAVGACAFVVVVALRKPAMDTPLASSGGALITGESVALHPQFKSGILEPNTIDFGNIAEPARETTPPAVIQATKTTDAPKATRRRSAGTRRSSVSVAANVNVVKVPGLSKSLSATPTSPSLDQRGLDMVALTFRDQAPAAAAFGADNGMSAPSNEIVRIESKVDLESGAAKAVEVKGNIEIGG